MAGGLVPDLAGRGARQYVQWARDCLSWAIYVFEKPGPG
jgi:hypothetical protein